MAGFPGHRCPCPQVLLLTTGEGTGITYPGGKKYAHRWQTYTCLDDPKKRALISFVGILTPNPNKSLKEFVDYVKRIRSNVNIRIYREPVMASTPPTTIINEYYKFFKLITVNQFELIKEHGFIQRINGECRNYISKELYAAISLGTLFSALPESSELHRMILIEFIIDMAPVLRTCSITVTPFFLEGYEHSISIAGDIKINLNHSFRVWSVTVSHMMQQQLRAIGALINYNAIDCVNVKGLFQMSGMTVPFIPAFKENTDQSLISITDAIKRVQLTSSLR